MHNQTQGKCKNRHRPDEILGYGISYMAVEQRNNFATPGLRICLPAKISGNCTMKQKQTNTSSQDLRFKVVCLPGWHPVFHKAGTVRETHRPSTSNSPTAHSPLKRIPHQQAATSLSIGAEPRNIETRDNHAIRARLDNAHHVPRANSQPQTPLRKKCGG